jgi:hypothetical protein
MKRVTRLLTCVLLIGLTLSAWAQDKQKISFKAPAENSKYTQQHMINVGDIPGHLIRISEIHRTFPTNPPVFDGVKAVESWTRLLSEITDGSGPFSGYTVFVLENGDKIFARVQGSSQLVANPDGTTTGNAASVAALTGGTGRFRGIRGVLRSTTMVNIIGGFNESQTDGEYWIEK